MNAIKIYSASACPYAQRSRMVLITKGIEFEVVEIDLKNKPDWFTAISPYGKVPLLEHGEAKVWESAVINEYLEEVFPQQPLMPQAALNRAKARIWIDFANTKFTTAFYKLLLAQEPEKQEEWRQELNQHCSTMEKGIQNLSEMGDYWLGRALSLVDLTYYPWFERLPVLEYYRGFKLPESCKNLRRWYNLMQAVPAVKQTQQSANYHIKQYEKYANNQASGVTAKEMQKY
jgi:glutathione S-transferase